MLTIYGGRAYEPQIEALTAGVDIVVGTPGRLLDLANRKNLDLGQVRALVLDEADKMLDLGFLPDVERLLRLTPDDRQTMLFSATMPGEVVTLARRHMRRPTNIRAEEPDELGAAAADHAARVPDAPPGQDRGARPRPAGQGPRPGHGLLPDQAGRDQVSTALADRGFAAATVHGDLGQSQRERALRAFRAGKVDVLVATDVAARGIDVDDVTHVVNYECPDDEKTYLHRIGRTGRAGPAGVAVTFVDWRDMHRWKLINDALGIGQPGARGDLLHVRAPVHRPVHPAGRHRHAAPRAARRPGRAGRGRGRGPRRDRQRTRSRTAARSAAAPGAAARDAAAPGAAARSGVARTRTARTERRGSRRNRSRSRGGKPVPTVPPPPPQPPPPAVRRDRAAPPRPPAPAASGRGHQVGPAPPPDRGGRELVAEAIAEESRPPSRLPDMSTPTSLELPEGTRRGTVATARGKFAVLDAHARRRPL